MTSATHIMASALAALVAVTFMHTAPAGDIPQRFEVAEDQTRFVFEKQGPRHDDGMPAYGNGFVTQGYIYPVGTLDGNDGVLANGDPEFPDKVIGEWTCYGRFVGDGVHTETGPWVVSKQIYDFSEESGQRILISQGYELIDKGKPVERAVTGGTGPFANARGMVEQTALGFHQHEGVRLRFETALYGS